MPEGAGSILAIAVLLTLSGFAASSETAIFSLTRFQLRRIRDHYKKAFYRIRTLLSRPTRLLVLILLINEFVNTGVTSLITDLVHRSRTGDLETMGREWLMTSLITMSISIPLIVLVGEITPKLVAAKMNKLVALFNTRPLYYMYRGLLPVLWLIDAFVGALLKLLGVEAKDFLSKRLSVVSEEDFVAIMEEGHREGTVNQDERELITNVLELDDSTAGEIMTRIEDAFCVSETARIADVLPEIRVERYARIPVYKGTRKTITGILLVKNLLKIQIDPSLGAKPVRDLASEPLYVRPDIKLSVLFRKFKSTKSHIAIIVNNHDVALGLVTMEDVLECIFGEIEDENDVRESQRAPKT